MRFSRCKKCGKVITYIKDSNNIPTYCCGEIMEDIACNTTEGSSEKHIPILTRLDNNIVSVSVGSVLHPTVREHYIQWVLIVTNLGRQRKLLLPGETPIVSFAVLDNEKVLEVYAYCNIHGLYKAYKVEQ